MGTETPEQLRLAVEQQRVQSLHGFGPLSEQRTLVAVTGLQRKDQRYRRDAIEPVAQALVAGLNAMPGVHQAFAVGSLSTDNAVQRVLAKGPTHCSLLHTTGVQIDVRAVAPAILGAAAMYFTGLKTHNIALRQLAQSQGLKLNEYCLCQEREPIAGATEEGVFTALGLAYIAPESREDRGELAAAASHTLPNLLHLSDLQGDLHVHTTDSDGMGTLKAMAAAAQARGLHYLAIAGHASRLGVQHGLDEDRLLRQTDHIDALNARQPHCTLLKGVEVEIREGGTLASPDAILRRLDMVVGAVHSGFDLNREKQTGRVSAAAFWSSTPNPRGWILMNWSAARPRPKGCWSASTRTRTVRCNSTLRTTASPRRGPAGCGRCAQHPHAGSCAGVVEPKNRS